MANEYKVSLNSRNSAKLEAIAKKLGVNKKDVLEKGLKLMELYAENENTSNNVSITVKKEDGEVDNFVLL